MQILFIFCFESTQIAAFPIKYFFMICILHDHSLHKNTRKITMCIETWLTLTFIMNISMFQHRIANYQKTTQYLIGEMIKSLINSSMTGEALTIKHCLVC